MEIELLIWQETNCLLKIAEIDEIAILRLWAHASLKRILFFELLIKCNGIYFWA